MGKKTGTTFPITFNNNQNYNALYDTGAGASLINYSAYVSLGKDLNFGYQPFIKLENVKFEKKIFKPSLQPMYFICVDLIGEFYSPTSHGHHYALPAVCMLTGFTWCIPLKTKTTEEVTKAYLDHIYSIFEGSVKIRTDNGTEFKNKLFKEVVKKLGTEFSIHSPPYRP